MPGALVLVNPTVKRGVSTVNFSLARMSHDVIFSIFLLCVLNKCTLYALHLLLHIYRNLANVTVRLALF